MRGYYRVPKKNPANRVDGALADLVRDKFADGWPKAIAREFHINRRTVARICSKTSVASSEQPFPRTEFIALSRRAILQKRRYFVFKQQEAPAQNQDEQG
jgi:hypothetical protein